MVSSSSSSSDDERDYIAITSVSLYDHDSTPTPPPSTNTSCSSRCQRRYPRLFTQLFWLYLILEGLCFVTDIAFLSTTVLAARNGGLRGSNSTSRTNAMVLMLLEEDDGTDDATDDATDVTGVEGQVATTTTTTEVDVTLDWETFETLLLEQWKLQWEQQQNFLMRLLGLEEEEEEEEVTAPVEEDKLTAEEALEEVLQKQLEDIKRQEELHRSHAEEEQTAEGLATYYQKLEDVDDDVDVDDDRKYQDSVEDHWDSKDAAEEAVQRFYRKQQEEEQWAAVGYRTD